METNIIHNIDCIDGLRKIPDKSVDLVIADPPYFKVISHKWDYQWRTEAEYFSWCQEWLKQIERILRLGGSFYLFGYFRTLAYLVPSIENLGLVLRQQIIVDKGIKAVSGRATKTIKCFLT